MTNKTYNLFASTLKEEVIDHYIERDPFGMIAFSEKKDITASGESEAIIAFQNTSIYSQFCDEHKDPWTYIKSEDDAYYRHAVIPCEIISEE